MLIKFKKLVSGAKLPTQATSGSAGFDLYAITDNDTVIEPGTVAKISTGLAMGIPEGYVGLVFARSGLAIKSRLALANAVGVIDSDYRGELIVALCNEGKEAKVVHNGDRIAQIIFMPVPAVNVEEVDDLDNTERGAGGFGSTGKN